MARRDEFSKKTQRAALVRSGYRCEAVTPQGDRCPVKVGDGAPVEFDHIVPASMGGDASLENCSPKCPLCHRLKTAREAPIRAEADRRRDAHDGVRTAPTRKIAVRVTPKPAPRNPATAPVEKLAGLPRRALFVARA